MKYFLRIIIFVLPTFLLASACKKEDKVEIPKEFPVNLLAERWEVRAETRLFSNNSEIKDQAVIRAFEERESLEDLFEKPFQQLEQEEGLRFESELEARFHAGDAVGELYDIQRKGTRFLFLSRSTYLINPQLPPSLNSLGFFLGMLEYTDRLGEPNAGGLRTTREVRVAHGNYKVLKASAFAYVLKHSDPNGAGEEALNLKGLEYNEFNANVIKHLRQNDTLAVKEYSIIYSLEK